MSNIIWHWRYHVREITSANIYGFPYSVKIYIKDSMAYDSLKPDRYLAFMSRYLKSTLTFFMHFIVASWQYVLSLIISSLPASLYVAEIAIPKLVFIRTLMAEFLIINFMYLRDDGTHHENDCSFCILFTFEYSDISTELVSFIYFRAMYEVLPDHNFTLSCDNLVVITFLLNPVVLS